MHRFFVGYKLSYWIRSNLFQAGRPSTSLTIGHLTSFAETLDEQYIIQPG
jgi:hypothetical protein